MARGKKVEVAASDFFVHRNLGIRDTAGMVAAAKLEEVCNDLAFIDQATRYRICDFARALAEH